MNQKELISKIKNLVITHSDRAIGRKLNLSKDQVFRFRKKNKIYRSAENNTATNLPQKPRKSFQPKGKTFIITSWEIRCNVSENFLKIINHIAEDQNAQKILTCCWPDDLRFIPPKLEENFEVVTNSFDFNENLRFEMIPTHALATNPTSQFKSFSHKSTIIPGLVRDLQTLPSIRLPKLVATAGSIGYLNAFSADYDFIEDGNEQRVFNKRWAQVSNRRGGSVYAIAKHEICPTALIINLYDDKYFHCRYISMHNKDYVCDLDKKYFADGRIEKNTPKALILSDIHEYNKDQKEFDKSIEMIDYFEPEKVFLNDYMDNCSVSHHDIHKAIKNIKMPTLDEEAESAKKTLTYICNKAKKVMYLQSNHCIFLDKWLDDSSAWLYNRNYITALELQLFRIKTGRAPIVKLLELDSYSNLEFVRESDRYFVGNTLIEHGHTGISGKRVGFYELAKLYGNYICGHFHSAKQFRNCAQVGKIIRSDIEYASTGASSWITANCLLNDDESKQLLFVIDGKWLKNR